MDSLEEPVAASTAESEPEEAGEEAETPADDKVEKDGHEAAAKEQEEKEESSEPTPVKRTTRQSSRLRRPTSTPGFVSKLKKPGMRRSASSSSSDSNALSEATNRGD